MIIQALSGIVFKQNISKTEIAFQNGTVSWSQPWINLFYGTILIGFNFASKISSDDVVCDCSATGSSFSTKVKPWSLHHLHLRQLTYIHTECLQCFECMCLCLQTDFPELPRTLSGPRIELAFYLQLIIFAIDRNVYVIWQAFSLSSEAVFLLGPLWRYTPM